MPLLRASGRGGSVINLSTIEAYRGAPPAAIYAAFKAAITGFVRSIALELGPENIRVNIIAPETTETPQVPVAKMIDPECRDHIERWIPMGRFGDVSDIAGCAVFLASDLSAWVTGTTIHVDGGALAAAGFYRTPTGEWTNFPVVSGIATRLAIRSREWCFPPINPLVGSSFSTHSSRRASSPCLPFQTSRSFYDGLSGNYDRASGANLLANAI